MLGVVLAGAAGAATSVTVSNHSFELPDVAGDLSATLAQDWAAQSGSPRLGNDTWSNIGSTPDPADAGQFVGYAVNYYQVLGPTMAANTEYTLTVDVGAQTGSGLGSGAAIRLGTGSTYGNKLLAAFVVSNQIPASGGWKTWSTTFGTGDGAVGESLRIELAYGSGGQTYFDNVRLTASNVTSLLADVPLQNATADFAQSGFPVANTIDGIIDSSGWAFHPNQANTNTAVYETTADLTESEFVFMVHQRSGLEINNGSLRFSVTTDDRSTFADGAGDVTASWSVLTPLTATTKNGGTGTINGNNSVTFADDNSEWLRITTAKSAVGGGITGIRMEVEPNGVNAVLTELEVAARQDPAAAGTITWSGESADTITATSAWAYATVSEDLTDAVLVWDLSDKGTGSVGAWTGSRVLGATSAGAVSAQATNLLSDTEYSWRYYGETASTSGWSAIAYTFQSGLSSDQKPVFTSAVAAAWNSIELGWEDNATHETGYLLQRSTNGTDFTLIASLGSNTTSVTDSPTTLVPTTYTYRLAATNGNNGSATAFADCETTAAALPPEGLIFYESFENPVVSGHSGGTDPTGWIGDLGLANESGAAWAFDTPYGDQVGWLQTGSSTTTVAILSEVLQEGYTYTLSFNVAARPGQVNAYEVDLMAGDTVLGTASGTPDSSDFSYSDQVLFVPDGSHAALLGETLVIRIGSTAIQPHFDNVMLRAVPPPAAGVVFAIK